MTDRYDDIISLPHHVSKTRPQMPLSDRAAQFSPFAALTGYDGAVEETARITDRFSQMTDEAKLAVNSKLRIAAENPETEVSITYFQPDKRKDGGEYVTAKGKIKQIDEYTRRVVLFDKTSIDIDLIRDLDGEIFW